MNILNAQNEGLFTGVLVMCLSVACWGQKAVISVNNFDANMPIYYLTEKGPSPVDTMVYVRLLGGPVGGPLTPVAVLGLGVIPIKIDTWIQDNGDDGYRGFFDLGIGEVFGVDPGGQAQFQLLAWAGPGDFENAIYWGKSEVWTQDVGRWDGPGTTPTFVGLLLPKSVVVGPHQVPDLSYAKISGENALTFSWTVGSQSIQLCSMPILGSNARPTVVGSDKGKPMGEAVTVTIIPTKSQEFFYLRMAQ